MPIVRLNRATLVAGVLVGLFAQQPVVTTVLFAVVLGATLFGRRGSLIFRIGSQLFPARNAQALAQGDVEDRRLMRFNNAIASVLLGLAQIAFLLRAPLLGWALALLVAAAAALALAGFCLGCFLYTQLKLSSARFAR